MLEACEEGYDNESTRLNESDAINSASPSGSLSYRPALLTIPFRGPARFRPLNPNLLRLAEWRLTVMDDTGAPAQTATVPAIPLSDQLERGGFRFAPTVRRYFGHEPELDWPPLHVHYEYTFGLPGGFHSTGWTCEAPAALALSPEGASQLLHGISNPWAVELVMEPGSIVGDWWLWVNNAGPLTSAGFAPTATHVRGSLGADITAMLRPGPNTLRIEIEGARPEGGLLNPLYLAGDFGVALNPVRLIERPTIGGFETYEANGLPFFAGVIEYARDFDLPTIPKGDRVLAAFATDAPFHEACEISINGGEWRALAREPRSLELPTAELRPGSNEVRVKVYTTLIRAFEGQWFDYEAHCYREIR